MVAVSLDRKSTRLNSSHTIISYAVFCLKKKKPHAGGARGGGDRGGGAGNRRHRAEGRQDARASGPAGIGAGPIGNIGPCLFFFNDPAPTEIYPLSLPAALPI